MRPSRCSSLVLVLALGGGSRAPAQTTVEGGAFLLLPVGARATALGQAATADGGTTEALYWNPAGLADLSRGEAAIHHYSAFFGNGDALAVAQPLRGVGTFAAGAYVVDYGTLDVTSREGGGPIGHVNPRNVALALAFATDVGALAAGIEYKLVQFRVDCSGDCADVPTAIGTTHAVDVGVRYALPVAAPLVVGLALRNLGFRFQVNNEAQADPLPTRLVIGFAWSALRPAAGSDGLDVRLLADVEGAVFHGGSASPSTLVGIESGVRDVVRLRAGYAFLDTQARGPSLGLGVRVGRVGVDLARTFYASDALDEKEPVHISLRLAL